MIRLLKRFQSDDSGATAIEYSLIAAGIAVVIIAALTLVGADVQGIFQGLADSL
ncbi:MAG: Flp family type IVb pilin [Pseudomonadota bacterium]